MFFLGELCRLFLTGCKGSVGLLSLQTGAVGSCFMVSTVTSLIKTSVSARLFGLKIRSKARTSRAIQMTQFLSSLY